MIRTDPTPAEEVLEVRGQQVAFARSGVEWVCLGATLGGVAVDEITVEGSPSFPAWAAASMGALAVALPGAADHARTVLAEAAPRLLPETASRALLFDLVGTRLLDEARFELHFLLRAAHDPWLDTYGLWVARWEGPGAMSVRRDQT